MTALEQARALGMMAALGAALGGIYDLMGMMRRSRSGVGASDLLFGMLCALGMTLTALYLRMNPFRLYVCRCGAGHGRICRDGRAAFPGAVQIETGLCQKS